MRRFVMLFLPTLLAMAAVLPTERLTLAGPLDPWSKDCSAVTIDMIDETLGSVTLDTLLEYTNTLRLSWSPTADLRVVNYYLEVSSNITFDPVLTCELVAVPDTSWTFVLEADMDGILYCRVYGVNAAGRVSVPSAVESTVFDMTPPAVLHYVLRDHETGIPHLCSAGVVDAEIVMTDEPAESGCWRMRLSEDPEFSVSTVTLDSTCADTVQLDISAGASRKVVYCEITDYAGNVTIAEAVAYNEAPMRVYPSPYSPGTGNLNVVFRLPEDRQVTLHIYDQFGDLVWERTISGYAGINDGGSTNPAAIWDGRNRMRAVAGSGVYVCVVDHGDGEPFSQKFAVIR